MPNPMPSSWMRAATARSASDGSRRPLGWLCSSISPRSAKPGSASTLSTLPRATTRTASTTPSPSSVAAKHTSRPPASAIAARSAPAARGARRRSEMLTLGIAWGDCHGAEPSRSIRQRPLPASLFPLPSRFQRLLLRRREQYVVQDEPVARRVGVQRQIRGRVADRVLRVLGIVAAEERPTALAVVAVDVLGPRRAGFIGQHRDAGFEPVLHETS